MHYKEYDEQFQAHNFIKYQIVDKNCGLSWKARLVYSWLAFRLEYDDGGTFKAIAKATGLDRNSGVMTAITELKTHDLIALNPYNRADEEWTWYAKKPSLSDGKGFVKVFMPNSSCPLTVLDNLVLAHLVDVGRMLTWKWNRYRHAVLGDMVGASTKTVRRKNGQPKGAARSIKTNIERLQTLGLIDSDWDVRLDAILPEWFVKPVVAPTAGMAAFLEAVCPPDPVAEPPEPRWKRLIDEISQMLWDVGITTDVINQIRQSDLAQDYDKLYFRRFTIMHHLKHDTDKSYEHVYNLIASVMNNAPSVQS
jgi:hypothetical protein